MNIDAFQIFVIVMYAIDIIDSIQRDAAKNLLGSENFRKKMSSLLITCGSWWRGLYPQSCLFMFLCYVVVVVSRHIHNLLQSLVVFCCLFVFIIVTMDAMQEAQFGAVFCLFSYLIPSF